MPCLYKRDGAVRRRRPVPINAVKPRLHAFEKPAGAGMPGKAQRDQRPVGNQPIATAIFYLRFSVRRSAVLARATFVANGARQASEAALIAGAAGWKWDDGVSLRRYL